MDTRLIWIMISVLLFTTLTRFDTDKQKYHAPASLGTNLDEIVQSLGWEERCSNRYFSSSFGWQQTCLSISIYKAEQNMQRTSRTKVRSHLNNEKAEQRSSLRFEREAIRLVVYKAYCLLLVICNATLSL